MAGPESELPIVVGKISGKLDQLAETMSSMNKTLMEVHKNHGIVSVLSRGQNELFTRIRILEDRVVKGEQGINTALDHVQSDQTISSWLGERAIKVIVGVVMFLTGWILSSLPAFHTLFK